MRIGFQKVVQLGDTFLMKCTCRFTGNVTDDNKQLGVRVGFFNIRRIVSVAMCGRRTWAGPVTGWTVGGLYRRSSSLWRYWSTRPGRDRWRSTFYKISISDATRCRWCLGSIPGARIENSIYIWIYDGGRRIIKRRRKQLINVIAMMCWENT